MTVIGVLGSKGGCGASLVATNLAVSLTNEGKSLLVDLHQVLAYDDLLLDLTPERSWMDLIPVAHELTDHHLKLAFVTHGSGLKLLAAPERLQEIDQPDVLKLLIRGLANRFDWVIVDLPSGVHRPGTHVFGELELLLLISTGDLPSIRNSKRIQSRLPEKLHDKSYLVMNQIGRSHPVEPRRVARALGMPLLASLPPDSHAVGYQVSYGTPTIFDSRSHFGRGILELTKKVIARLTGDQVGGASEEAVPRHEIRTQERESVDHNG